MIRVRSLSLALVALVALVVAASSPNSAQASHNNSGNHSSSCHPSGNFHYTPSYCTPSYSQPRYCEPIFNSCCYCVWYYDCQSCTWKCYQTCGSYSDACFYSNNLKMRGLQVKISRK